MKNISFCKLVRDKIPAIIESDGKTCISEILSDTDYRRLLDEKLNEECAEYQKSKSAEELADILEVVYAIAPTQGLSIAELEQLRSEKADKRGEFAQRILLKVLYTQQLGRGMRLADGKECLMVFDFVGNASQYNMPESLHRLFQLKDYRPGALALGSMAQKTAEDGLYAKGERPNAIIDWPVDVTGYELVDIFN